MLQLPGRYTSSKPALVASHRRGRKNLNDIEAHLGAIWDIRAFAEPRLKAAIQQQFSLDLDVKNVYFARKYGFKSRDDLYGFLVFEQTRDSALSYRYRGLLLLGTLTGRLMGRLPGKALTPWAPGLLAQNRK